MAAFQLLLPLSLLSKYSPIDHRHLDFRSLSNQNALVKVPCVNKGKGNRDDKPQKKPPPTEQIIKCRTVDENTDF